MALVDKQAPGERFSFGWVAFGIYTVYFVVLFFDVVFGEMSFARRDISTFYLPAWHHTVRSLSQGELPLWNPYNSFGVPFFANFQTVVLYPATVLFYLTDFVHGFNLYIVFHFILASFFTYLWMSDCGASRWGAFLAGFAFGVSGYLMSTINLTISLSSVCYFPLALLCFRRSVRREGFFWPGLAALVLYLQFLAGDPAIVFASLLAFFLTAVYLTITEKTKTGPARWHCLVKFTKIFGSFLCLTAAHALLFLEYLPLSDRFGLDAGDKMQWSMPPADFLGFFIPFFTDWSGYVTDYWSRQSWLEKYYAGATVVVLAVVGCRGRRRQIISCHILLFFLGLVLAGGKHSILYAFFCKVVPFLDVIRYPVRFFFLTAFATACLAGFGFDRVFQKKPDAVLSQQPSGREQQMLLFGLVAVLTFLCFANAGWVEQNLSRYWIGRMPHSPLPPEAIRQATHVLFQYVKWTLLFLTLTGAALLLGRYTRARVSLAACFMGTLVFLDLTYTNPAMESVVARDVIWRASPNIEMVARDKGLFRATASPLLTKQFNFFHSKTPWEKQIELKDKFAPNALLFYAIPDAAGYDSLFLRNTDRLFGLFHQLKTANEARFVDMLNIKYLTSPLEEVGEGYRRLNQTPHANLFQNQNVLPRAFLVKGAEVVEPRDAIFAKIFEAGQDPQERIFIEEEPAPADFIPVQGPNQTEVLEYSAHRIRIHARVSDKPWLFLSDTHYPGWKAFVDGRPAKIYRANYAFRAVRLPRGTHEVLWVYDPFLFKLGAGITAGFLLFLMSYYLRVFLRRKRVA